MECAKLKLWNFLRTFFCAKFSRDNFPFRQKPIVTTRVCIEIFVLFSCDKIDIFSFCIKKIVFFCEKRFRMNFANFTKISNKFLEFCKSLERISRNKRNFLFSFTFLLAEQNFRERDCTKIWKPYSLPSFGICYFSYLKN